MKTQHAFALSVIALLLGPVVLFGAGLLMPVAMLLLLVVPILAIAGLLSLFLRPGRATSSASSPPHPPMPHTGIFY